MVVSIKPSEMIEGGLPTIERNLTWKQCRFNLFDYTNKAGEIVATTVAAKIVYVTDDGEEVEQQYSVGDPSRFQPSADGKTLEALGAAISLSKSSNFSLLMNAVVNSGFPENKLTGDLSVLDGMQTYNIGIPEPKRAGIVRTPAVEGTAVRERLISVPSVIHKLPWDKKGAKKAVEGGGEDVTAAAIKFVGATLDAAEGDTVTRQELATAVFTTLAKDPNKDAIANLIFQPGFQGALLANGFTMDGEVIGKA